jgi:NAD(P)-dependent dehydrogenase (short-subunit alcohol dehydrogenase family)
MNNLLANRVAIVTGAGRGLGRSHALAVAREGARVVVSDVDADAARQTCEEIERSGGEAMWNRTNVQELKEAEAMVAEAIGRWGQVDILVNNAGILRDRTFANADLEDFRLVLEVHLMGSVNCTRAVWLHMKERGYGRVILTTSSSGLYGNFGQSNYSAAKMGIVGLMHTLAMEGSRYGIHVNCIAPSAATQMTDPLLKPEDLLVLDPKRVSPGVVALASEKAPNKCILLAGGGSFKMAEITMTQGIYLADDELDGATILAQWDRIADRSGEVIPSTGPEQYEFEVARARAAMKSSKSC